LLAAAVGPANATTRPRDSKVAKIALMGVAPTAPAWVNALLRVP